MYANGFTLNNTAKNANIQRVSPTNTTESHDEEASRRDSSIEAHNLDQAALFVANNAPQVINNA